MSGKVAFGELKSVLSKEDSAMYRKGKSWEGSVGAFYGTKKLMSWSDTGVTIDIAESATSIATTLGVFALGIAALVF